MAPERVRRGQTPLPTDAPASILRRQVLLSFPLGLNTAERQRQLEATVLFRRVALVPPQATPIPWAQANSEPFGSPSSDPHRWQWALAAIAVPGTSGAWHLTTGRATVGSVESGIIPGHPDVPTTALANFRGHSSTRIRWLGSAAQLFPGELGITDPPDEAPPHHGTHVNTLMAAPINGQGIAGVCPTCTLQTFRAETPLVWPDSWNLAGRFGMAAFNMSNEPVDLVSTPPWFWPLSAAAFSDLLERDVLIVASAGNHRVARSDWNAFWPPGSDTIPHGNPAVLKIGATDADNHLWNEARIVTLPLFRRHPVLELAQLCTTPGNFDCIPWVIANRCIGTTGGEQCGSSFGTNVNVIDLVAPGAQVVAGMVAGSNPNPNHYIGLPGDLSAPIYAQNPNAWAPSRTGLGVGSNGVFVNAPDAQHSWGPMTGTSMAAPHVTATAGLMRSINPLVSAEQVRVGLKSRANNTVPGYTAERMGAGLLNARHAVENAAGQIRGVYQRNRLVPMFSMFAALTQEPSEAVDGELEGVPQDINAWLFTTNPQLASAAMAGDIYLSDTPSFSPTRSAAYLHSNIVNDPQRRIGIGIAPSIYQLPPGAGKGLRNPSASFYVFTTPHSPSGLPALIPLYRLTTHHGSGCEGDQRKHLYTTRQSEALGFINGIGLCNAPAYSMGYRFESIEGYVFDRSAPRPAGTLALFRGLNNGLNTTALIVETEQLTTAFAGYAVNVSTSVGNSDFLGWVYPTFVPTGTSTPSTTLADQDSDGLIDGLEIALRISEQSANSDCEGAGDAAEYGFAELPIDPVSLTPNCADPRVRVVRPNPNAQGEARVIFSNPVGPMAIPAGSVVRVTFFQGNGWPVVIPSGCFFDDSEVGSSFEHYLCTISTPMAPFASAVEFVFQVEARTNPSAPLHQASVVVPAGFTDPGLPGNNVSTF